MREVPENWEETSFGEVVRSVAINDKKLPKKQYATGGKFPVVDQGQEFIGGYSDDADRVVDEDLPLIIFGDHTRIFKFLNRPFVPGADGVKVLKPVGVDEKWLYHIAHALEFPDKGYARHFQHLKKARLLVPPFPEQRRIVARIEELFSRLDAGVAALRHAKAQLQRYRQSVLAAAVTGQLTQAWREQHPNTEPAAELLERILKLRPGEWTGRGKYKTPTPPDTEGLPDLPATWSWTNFETLAKAEKHALKAGPFGSALKKEFYVPSGYKIYGQEQVIKDDPYFGDYYIDEERFQSLNSCETKPGDFLISLVGTIGRTMIVPEDAEPGIINPRLVKMSLDRRLIDPRLLKVYLGSSRVKAFFKRTFRTLPIC